MEKHRKRRSWDAGLKGGDYVPESVDRGALTEAVYYILLSVVYPMHGYGIMQNVSEMSRGRVKLGPGTLYGAINTLLEKGWIRGVSAEKNARKKEYVITEAGLAVLKQELVRLIELIENGRDTLKKLEDGNIS